jgi:hypothetical protein
MKPAKLLAVYALLQRKGRLTGAGSVATAAELPAPRQRRYLAPGI